MRRHATRGIVRTLLVAALALGGCGGGGGGGVAAPVFALLSILPAVFQANIATAFEINAENAGNPGAATIRFTALAGTPFDNGSSATLEVPGQVESATRITGTTNPTGIAAQVIASVTVILPNNDSAQLGANATFNPPPPPPAMVDTEVFIDTIFDNLAETPRNQAFSLGGDGFRADFDAAVFTKGDPDLYIANSVNAFGFNQTTGTVGIDFNSPASFIVGQARAKGAGADAMITVFDANQAPCGMFQLPTNGFATFCFTGAIVRLELTSNTAGTDAVIGELNIRSADFATIFNGNQGGVDFDTETGNIVMPLYDSQPVQAAATGRVLSEANFRIAPSDNALGVQGNETASIDFSTPVRFLHLLVRGSGPGSGFATSNAAVTVFDAFGGQANFNVSNAGFELISISTLTSRVELANTVPGAIAVIGLFAASGNILHTNFTGTDSGVDLDALVNQPGQFVMPGGRAQATFDGTILSVNEPNMYVPPSMNAFGVDGNATATITFDAPVNVVSGVARGSGPDTSRPTSDGQLVARDASNQIIATINLSNAGFEPFCITGQIMVLELTNTVDNALAVLGELGVVGVPPDP